MGWFRMWDDILDSVKVHRLAPSCGWAWVRLMAVANRHDFATGTLPDLDTIAFWLRLTREQAGAMVDECIAAGLLDFDGDTLAVHDWAHWQPPKDPTSAARSQKYRDAKRDAHRDAKRDARRGGKRGGACGVAVTVTGEDKEEDGRRKTEDTEKERAARDVPDTNRIDDGPPEWQAVIAKAKSLWGTRRFPEALRESFGTSPYANGALMHWWEMGPPEAFVTALVELRAKPDDWHTVGRFCAFVKRVIERPASGPRLAKAEPEPWSAEEQREYYAARYAELEAEEARKVGA